MDNVVLMYSKTLRPFAAVLPSGFSIRNFEDPQSDRISWALIETAAREFDDVEKALKKFDQWTEEDWDRLREKMFFVVDDETGNPVGTITAWSGELDGQDLGRLHWLAVLPEYEGKGLGKSLVSKAIDEMLENHESAYLKTQTHNVHAIGIYYKAGFSSYQRGLEDKSKWMAVDRAMDAANDHFSR